MPYRASRRKAMGHVGALLALATTWPECAHAAATPDAPALPTELQDSLPAARNLGGGRLRFLGMGIYDSRLWVSGGFNASAYAQSPFALELSYLRGLSGKLIAERSLKEMWRQGPLSPQQEQAWLPAMLLAFPDVQTGDRITGLHTPGAGARFWFNGQARASIADADFSRVFFGIWLSDASSEPQLRASLLGQTP
jgi:hypothetical protein